MPINYSHYPKNWKTEIVPAVKARANNCCENCGVKNHLVIKRNKNGTYRIPSAQEWDMIFSKVKHGGYNLTGSIKFHGFTKVVLTVAHLDHDSSNHDVKLDRLAALCQRCHLKYDLKRHIENRKYGINHRRNNLQIQF